ncbi:cupin domain-containing protein [Desulfonatronum thioautotrophicum]|uniref:cupin domain-containing protein n=1 Tax=Desulfonatronum thioautotrophicum TaxID=617001 RepID=UPI00069B04A9|nr:cupin domain-containing protein [Desulfonatronum thioautotrophicum]
MQGMFLPSKERDFADHPKFAGVRIAVLVRGTDSDRVSVSQLEIAPGVEVPIHTHDPQLDSIFVLSGEAEVYINGEWVTVGPEDYLLAPSGVEHGVRNSGQVPLRLFIHHSPPLL